MKKYDLYVGCNVDGEATHVPAYVRIVIEQALAKSGFDGCTFTSAVGLWEGIEERTVICTICTEKPYADIYNLTSWIKQQLRQDSVMVVESEPVISFI